VEVQPSARRGLRSQHLEVMSVLDYHAVTVGTYTRVTEVYECAIKQAAMFRVGIARARVSTCIKWVCISNICFITGTLVCWCLGASASKGLEPDTSTQVEQG
jgi:hypothetical protein